MDLSNKQLGTTPMVIAETPSDMQAALDFTFVNSGPDPQTITLWKMTAANKTVTDFTIDDSGEDYATPAAIVLGGYHSATVIAHMQVHEITQIDAVGANYQVNDVVTLANGTGTKPTFKVTAVASGQVTALAIHTAGDMTVFTSGAQAVTGGNGTGLTLSLHWQVIGLTLDSALGTVLSAPSVAITGSTTAKDAAATAILGYVPTDQDRIINGQTVPAHGRLISDRVFLSPNDRWEAMASGPILCFTQGVSQ